MFTYQYRLILLHITCLLLIAGCKRENTDSERKFHIINLSLPRSATVSFAYLFLDQHSTHEYMMAESVFSLLDYTSGKINRYQLENFLLLRDQSSRHWVDSATFFFIAPEVVYETFPDAKYVFVLRPCDKWIASMIDRMRLLYSIRRRGIRTDDLRFLERYGEFFSPHISEKVLLNNAEIRRNADVLVRELALAWRINTLRALSTMAAMKPAQRLVLRIDDFDQSLASIAGFAGIPGTALHTQHLHANNDISLPEITALVGERTLNRYASLEQEIVDRWLDDYPRLMHRKNQTLAKK